MASFMTACLETEVTHGQILGLRAPGPFFLVLPVKDGGVNLQVWKLQAFIVRHVRGQFASFVGLVDLGDEFRVGSWRLDQVVETGTK
jgi:hypothetical protein